VSEERPHRSRVIDADTEHMIKNHLAVIAGYCELLLGDMPQDDPRRADLQEINRAALALIALFRRDART
jgi:hypothetical protein